VVCLTKIKISPLVTTLATMYFFEGIAQGFSNGDSVYSFNIANFFGNALIFNIPIQIYIYIIFAVIFYLLLSKTTLGRSLYAIGLNERATIYSGINTNKVKIGIYTLSGFVCSIASLTWLGRFTSIKFDAGESLNLMIVTVVVLGGTSILGGFGDIKGTIIATLIIAVLNSGLTVMDIPIDTQIIVNGVVLVISLITYAFLNARVKNKRILKIDSPAISAQKIR
jgi:ribose/xylose/arabinose/galactoside ABC-type transport system permease subunit